MAVRVILWITALGFCAIALALFLEPGGDPLGRGISRAVGTIVALIGFAAVAALLIAIRIPAVLYLAAAIVALPLIAIACFAVARVRDDARYKVEAADRESGKTDFKNPPALLAAAQAVANNDLEAIRAAGCNVPDLNAPRERRCSFSRLIVRSSDRTARRPCRLCSR